MTASAVNFDPMAPHMLDDPYPVYRQLRDSEPAHYSERFSTWVLSRYDDVRNALLDPATFCSAQGVLLGQDPGAFLPMVETTDPPDHAPLRALIVAAFRRGKVEPLERSLEELAAELIDRFIERGACDFTAEFAWPFPANVICELLGVPPDEREPFRDWAYELSTSRKGDLKAAQSIYAYFTELLELRRRQPGGDLVSALIAARVEGRALSQEELLGTCFQLVVAGHETTTNLLSNAMVLLGQDRELRSRLREDPALVLSAIEEFLRFEAPVQGLSRTLTSDVELHGRTLGAGDKVHLLFAAANRDERAFAAPDDLRPERAPNPHLSFGFGIHFCAGAHLARLEARIALTRLLERIPDFELVDERVQRLPSLMLRGTEALPLAFPPGPTLSDTQEP